MVFVPMNLTYINKEENGVHERDDSLESTTEKVIQLRCGKGFSRKNHGHQKAGKDEEPRKKYLEMRDERTCQLRRIQRENEMGEDGKGGRKGSPLHGSLGDHSSSFWNI